MHCVKVPYNVDHKRIYIDVEFLNHYGERKVFPCWAVVDTGATTTCITKQVVDAMGLLPSRNTIFVTGMMGRSKTTAYYVILSIPKIGFSTTKKLRVLEMKSKMSIDVILGMDVLSQGTFKFKRKFWTFDFKKKDFTLCIK